MTYQQRFNAMQKVKDLQENIYLHIELLNDTTSKTKISTLLSKIEYYQKELLSTLLSITEYYKKELRNEIKR